MHWFIETLEKIPAFVCNSVMCIVIILSVFVSIDIKTLSKLSGTSIAEMAELIQNFESLKKLLENAKEYRTAIYVIAGIVGCCYLIRWIFRKKAIVLRHNSFSNNLAQIDKEVLEDFCSREVEIDIVQELKDKRIAEAIIKQDGVIEKILSECNQRTTIFYYGIAHLPFIFRAGYQIGDEGKVRLLHKYRNGDDIFHEIPIQDDLYSLELRSNVFYEGDNNTSQNMLVVIATSMEVSQKDFQIFSKKGIYCELLFSMSDPDMYGFDSVCSYDIMKRFRTQILGKIRKFVVEKNINHIDLVLATSSDFAFYIAQGFSANHDPDITVYNYDRKSEVKYPWGLKINHDANNALYLVEV